MHNVHCCCYLVIKKFDVYLLIYQHRQCTTSIGATAPHGRSNSSYYLCKNKNKRQIVLANRFFNFSFIISRERMLMCGKVTHKNLIDSSPLFRKNIISKPSRASQRQVNGLSPTVDSPVCPCWWIIKGRQQKVLPPFPIIKERERLHD